MKQFHRFAVAGLLLMAFSSLALAQDSEQDSPGNPCGGKMAMNPCAKNAMHFQVTDPMGRNSVTFSSKAPLEDIVGTSREITGYIAFDPQNPAQGAHGELIVPIASLNTGIPLRDEHLQGQDWLAADSNPQIKLAFDSVTQVQEVKKTSEFQTYDLTIAGKLSLHGQTRAVKIPGRVTFLKESDKTQQVMPGDLLAVRASFDVKLADFGITGPKGAGLIGSKVGEEVTVEVSFRATNADARMAANPGNPCGGKAMNPCGGKAMNPCGGKAMNPSGGK